MRTTTERQSLWLAEPGPEYPALSGEQTADVAVIGAGITGLTTALLLKRAGLRVAVVEADRVGHGASGNNTAKVSALQATVYSELSKQYGATAAAGYAEANLAGVETLAGIVKQKAIECDLRRRPAVTYAITESERAGVAAEFEAAGQAGLPVVHDPNGVDLPFPVSGAVRLDDQLSVHPVRYLRGLAAAVDGDGSRVFEHSRVLRVWGRPGTHRGRHGSGRTDRDRHAHAAAGPRRLLRPAGAGPVLLRRRLAALRQPAGGPRDQRGRSGVVDRLGRRPADRQRAGTPGRRARCGRPAVPRA